MRNVSIAKQQSPDCGVNVKRNRFLIAVVLFAGLWAGHLLEAQDRPAAAAGSYYNADPIALALECKQYIEQAKPEKSDIKPLAIISPHAGYAYSGSVAGYAFRSLQGQHYDAAIVISPCHVDYFPFASVYSGDAYVTPLGKVEIDKKLAADCVTLDNNVRFSERGHVTPFYQRGEHSLEIQLPLLQTVLPGIPIVPIVLGTMDRTVIQSLGESLSEIVSKKNVLLIASSDLSHYHDYGNCQKIDKRLMQSLQKMNPDPFYSGLISKDFEACGGGPITAVLIAARAAGANSVDILQYLNSGDVAGGDRSRVVGYMAAAIYKSTKSEEIDMQTHSLQEGELTREEELFLLQLAENTVKAVVSGEDLAVPENIPKTMREKRGAFVTLEKNHQLRGCIGYIMPIYPLYETVINVAESAALKDPRFNPVTPDELKDISVEVSVLTVPRKITDPAIIEVGKHGIIIKKGFYQGLLLPQVATDYGWDRKTFLEHTCMKAGLAKNAWKDRETEIRIFSAQVFNRESIEE